MLTDIEFIKIFIQVIAVLASLTVLFFKIKNRKHKKKKKSKKKHSIKIPKIYRDLNITTISIIIFAIGFYSGYNLIKIYINSDRPEILQGLRRDYKAMNTSEAEPIKEADLILFNFQQEGLVVYDNPDENAEEMYRIEEDMYLEKIDQTSGWYRIMLDDGTHGWVKIKDL